MGSAGLRDAITGAVNTSVMVDYYEWEFDENPAGTTAQVRPLLTELTEGFSGWASPDDLDDLLVLMHLHITEPRVAEFAVAEQVEILQTHKDNYDNNPHWTAVVELDDARYQDSPWYHFNLTQEEIDAVTADGLLEL